MLTSLLLFQSLTPKRGGSRRLFPINHGAFYLNRVPERQNSRRSAIVGSMLALAIGSPQSVRAQASSACAADRTVSTLVGAGLGAAAAAIPATIVHRHDQTSSHRIVAVSITTGALIGFVAAGRDRPCVARADSLQTTEPVMARRSSHARRGALAGAFIGGVLGAAGGTLYNIGCTEDPCHATRERVGIMLFSAGEGAVALGVLGSLIGWAWPTGQQ